MILLCLFLALQEPPGAAPEAWVTILRSDKVEEREQAAQRLKKLGKAAIPLVQPLLKDKDPELARRAREIVEECSREEAHAARLKLEETLLKSKTVRLKFVVGTKVPNNPEPQKPLSGELLVKEGGKVRFWMIDPKGESLLNCRVVSDGKKVRYPSRGQGLLRRNEVAESEAPPRFSSDVLLSVLRAGVMAAMPAQVSQLNGTYAEIAPLLKVRKEGLVDPAEGLHYELGLGDREYALEHWLVCRPEQGLLTSRTVRELGRDRGVLSETYSEMTLDADLPDTLFDVADK